MAKPTKPTVPAPALRSQPDTFNSRVEANVLFWSTLATYMDDVGDFTDEKAAEALAAAIGGDLPPLTGKALNLLRVNSGESAAELATIADILDIAALTGRTLTSPTINGLTGGVSTTAYNAGTKSGGTFTPDEANGNHQYATNNGAHTLAPPSNNCTLIVHYTNGASAGAITASGFTLADGDSFTTTVGDEFLCYVAKVNDVSHLSVKALQ